MLRVTDFHAFFLLSAKAREGMEHADLYHNLKAVAGCAPEAEPFRG
jgi:hypothetical protein